MRTLSRPKRLAAVEIPDTVNKLLAMFGVQQLPKSADLESFAGDLAKLVDYLERTGGSEARKVMSNKLRGLPSPADHQRREIAERVARQRGISVEAALAFVPD